MISEYEGIYNDIGQTDIYDPNASVNDTDAACEPVPNRHPEDILKENTKLVLKSALRDIG